MTRTRPRNGITTILDEFAHRGHAVRITERDGHYGYTINGERGPGRFPSQAEADAAARATVEAITGAAPAIEAAGERGTR